MTCTKLCYPLSTLSCVAAHGSLCNAQHHPVLCTTFTEAMETNLTIHMCQNRIPRSSYHGCLECTQNIFITIVHVLYSATVVHVLHDHHSFLLCQSSGSLCVAVHVCIWNYRDHHKCLGSPHTRMYNIHIMPLNYS